MRTPDGWTKVGDTFERCVANGLRYRLRPEPGPVEYVSPFRNTRGDEWRVVHEVKRGDWWKLMATSPTARDAARVASSMAAKAGGWK